MLYEVLLHEFQTLVDHLMPGVSARVNRCLLMRLRSFGLSLPEAQCSTTLGSARLDRRFAGGRYYAIRASGYRRPADAAFTTVLDR